MNQPNPRIIDMDPAPSDIDGLLVITMKQVTDDRGTVREFFRTSSYADPLAGLGAWQQVNVTETVQGAIRGLHGESTAKLVACVAGEAFGAYLDTREDSPTYGALVTVPLVPGSQVLVPPGVCNGFQAVSAPTCQYLYCFTDEWTPGMTGVAYSPLDPGLGIDWPLPIDATDPAILSTKDAGAPLFSQRSG